MKKVSSIRNLSEVSNSVRGYQKLKSNLKSPPTFLLFLQSDYCYWSTRWQIFQKWAIICLKSTFWPWWKRSFWRRGLQELWKEPKCSCFPLTSVGLKFHTKILLGMRQFGLEETFPSRGTCQVKSSDPCKAGSQARSKSALLPLTSVFHFCWWHHILAWCGW